MFSIRTNTPESDPESDDSSELDEPNDPTEPVVPPEPVVPSGSAELDDPDDNDPNELDDKELDDPDDNDPNDNDLSKTSKTSKSSDPVESSGSDTAKSERSTLLLYNKLEDLLYNKDLGEDEDIPNLPLPIPTEDITGTSQLLDMIRFIKEHKLYKINESYLNLVQAETAIRNIDLMIGMDKIKEIVVDQIMSMSKPTMIKKGFINTVIYGAPGCGKTTLARLLGEIYKKFSIAKTGQFIVADRASLIGMYVGHTAEKTKKILQKAHGGILFIDEVYQLGCHQDGNRDSFAKECIDTINQYITDHAGELIIIVAGYKEEVEKNFFAQNEGLDRRFPFVYSIDPYKTEDLYNIFVSQAREHGYTVANPDYVRNIFNNNTEFFKHSGGDTESFLYKCAMVHEKRTISFPQEQGLLSYKDIDRGFSLHKKTKNSTKQELPDHVKSMYS